MLHKSFVHTAICHSTLSTVHLRSFTMSFIRYAVSLYAIQWAISLNALHFYDLPWQIKHNACNNIAMICVSMPAQSIRTWRQMRTDFDARHNWCHNRKRWEMTYCIFLAKHDKIYELLWYKNNENHWGVKCIRLFTFPLEKLLKCFHIQRFQCRNLRDCWT